MENFENLFEVYRSNCDPSIFEKLIKENELLFFKNIFNRINHNIETKNNYYLKENIPLLVIVFQLFPNSNDKLENLFSTKISTLFKKFISFYLNDVTINNIDIQNIYKNINVFIDIFFHNPIFVDYLNEDERKDFLISFIKLTDLKYDVKTESDLRQAMEHSVAIFFYFPEELIKDYKKNYQFHFDEFVVDEFIFLDE